MMYGFGDEQNVSSLLFYISYKWILFSYKVLL